jgi:outer membrane protein assembly factor BamB
MNRKNSYVMMIILLSLSFSMVPSCSSGDENAGKGPGDNMPSVWSTDKNVRWSYDLAGRGWSSPVIYGNKVFITTALNETKPPVPEEEKPEEAPPPPPPPQPPTAQNAPAPGPPDNEGPEEHKEDTTYKSEVYRWEITCLNLKTGKELWKRVALKGSPRIGSHKGNGYASETPVTDGKRVYAYFGMTGIFCYDMKGKLLWEKDLGSYKTLNNWGTGSSPVLYNNKVFLQIDNEVNSFIVALDALTGDEKWRVARDEKTTYSTPFIWINKSGTELVTCGKTARSYDPETGKVLWEMKMKGDMSIPSPVADNDHLYIGNAGEDDIIGGLYSVKAGVAGDITPDTITMVSSGVEWYSAKAPLETPSPVLHNGLIYLLAGNGKNLSCIDATTGKTVYDQKLEKVSSCWATPWVYKDNLYITDERGSTHIVKTGDKFELLSQNRIKDKFWASAAIGYDAYVFKGVNKLYCISSE